jgi:hypothetical protein
MKQHPDRQPRSAETMQRRDDDNRRTDQDLESYWIDGVAPIGISTQRTQSNDGAKNRLCIPLRKPLRPLS